MALAGARIVGVCAAVLFPVHQAEPFGFWTMEFIFPQHGTSWPARADKGFRKRGNLWRFADRAIYVEATARHGIVPGMRPMHDQLSHRRHWQNAQSEISGDRATRAFAG